MGKFEKRQPTFFQVYIKISFTQLENHSQLLCGLDFANKKTLALRAKRICLLITEIKKRLAFVFSYSTLLLKGLGHAILGNVVYFCQL